MTAKQLDKKKPSSILCSCIGYCVTNVAFRFLYAGITVLCSTGHCTYIIISTTQLPRLRNINNAWSSVIVIILFPVLSWQPNDTTWTNVMSLSYEGVPWMDFAIDSIPLTNCGSKLGLPWRPGLAQSRERKTDWNNRTSRFLGISRQKTSQKQFVIPLKSSIHSSNTINIAPNVSELMELRYICFIEGRHNTSTFRIVRICHLTLKCGPRCDGVHIVYFDPPRKQTIKTIQDKHAFCALLMNIFHGDRLCLRTVLTASFSWWIRFQASGNYATVMTSSAPSNIVPLKSRTVKRTLKYVKYE